MQNHLALRFEPKREKAKMCPCGKSNKDGKFSPFLGYVDKGYCHSCDKTYMPDSNKSHNYQAIAPTIAVQSKPSYIEQRFMVASCGHYHQNQFVLWLIERFGQETAMKAVNMYRVGTSKKWLAATIFWQIDRDGNIRSGKIMQYDSNFHRVKSPQSRISWVHKELRLKEFNLEQCFFGEHLLSCKPKAKVGIVESEKTAIVASIYFPDIIWIATGGKIGCRWDSPKTNVILHQREVILYPDLGAYDLWREKAVRVIKPCFQVSSLLENNATEQEKVEGLDLADYLLQFDLAPFIHGQFNCNSS
jgi:hypothetical protein